jgi:hypothetical protein
MNIIQKVIIIIWMAVLLSGMAVLLSRMAVLLSMTNQNQLYAGPLEDAKSQIEKERYNKRVEHVKRLLREKKNLENKIKDIDSKLERINKGEVLLDDYPQYTTQTIPMSYWQMSNN